MGDFLIPMHIDECIHPVLFHLRLSEEHLRARLDTGVLPGPVEVLALEVGTQVAEEGAIRVHVRDQVQVGFFQQLLHGRIIGLQAVDHPLHEPLGHVFARVLLGNQP